MSCISDYYDDDDDDDDDDGDVTKQIWTAHIEQCGIALGRQMIPL